jgi:hypothetical protein
MSKYNQSIDELIKVLTEIKNAFMPDGTYAESLEEAIYLINEHAKEEE